MASKQGVKRAPRKAKISAQKSVKRGKRLPRGKPFASDNPYKFKSKEELGGALDPKINVGGRPKLLSGAYKEWLAEEDARGLTNAKRVAVSQGNRAANGFTDAAREIRSATEGENINLNDKAYEDYLARLKRFVEPDPADAPGPDAAATTNAV